MSSEATISVPSIHRVDGLENDERWNLVQRIVASERFQRAGQLKKMLLYISEAAILHPEVALHEYEIACNALSRRKDFNPVNDNIVRAQFINLRRKLEQYFQEEGRLEPLVLVIPKGSYNPVFQAVAAETVSHSKESSREPDMLFADARSALHNVAAIDDSIHSANLRVRSRWKRLGVWLAVIGLIEAVVLITLVAGRFYIADVVRDPRSNQYNPAFLQLLSQMGGQFSVVLPDTSEMMIHLFTRQVISPNDYAAKDYPQRQIETLADPDARKLLYLLSFRRNTTETEARLAFDFIEAIHSVNLAAKLQYARDIHVRDFNEGNTILIGSQDSNPWVALFVDRTNFQLKQAPGGERYFENVKPLSGEQNRYIIDTPADKGTNQYVSVALLPNPASSGFILMITGSDTASVEGASEFLLHGKMSSNVETALKRRNLDYFEMFFRSIHMEGQSENKFELLSLRTNLL